MNLKSLLVGIGVVACTGVIGEENLAEAQIFGGRRGSSYRIGISPGQYTPPRYYGPAFYAAPRSYGSYSPGSTQWQRRPWYYYRSGSFEYYRPSNPLYRTR